MLVVDNIMPLTGGIDPTQVTTIYPKDYKNFNFIKMIVGIGL